MKVQHRVTSWVNERGNGILFQTNCHIVSLKSLDYKKFKAFSEWFNILCVFFKNLVKTKIKLYNGEYPKHNLSKIEDMFFLLHQEKDLSGSQGLP